MTEQKLTKTKKILPQEWISDFFNPVIGVLASKEVEALCQKNNLTMVELLEPFARLTSEVTIKDPEGANHSIANLSLTFQDFNKDISKNVGPRLLNDTVASITEEPLVSRAFPSRSLQLEAPGFTPWFDAWTKLYLQSIPSCHSEHEFLRHHLGCVFVISSNCKDDAIDELNDLVQKQRKIQHEKQPMQNNPYPQYFNANIFKYFVLLHDVYSVEESKAHEIFRQMQNAFGSSSCHLLQVNSRTVQNDGDDANPNVAEHWTSMTFTNRFSHIETRLKAVVGDNVLIPTQTVQEKDPKINEAPKEVNNSDLVDHPLANHPLNPEEKSPPPSPSVMIPKLVPVTKENIAIHLTYNDVDRIKILIKEFVIKCLVPHCERQLRLLHEIVTNRKSRSLFSGAKRWFGQSKPGVATGTSVIYGKEAPELQLRKMADLYFMLKLYKHAYNHYHTAKKDFQSDEAWNYYAGAAEMCALAQFMQGDSVGKKYPAHYMEDSITKYLQVCQMPEFAIRASLFDALCLKYQGLFHEAALSYVRMTNEAKDLRSALLLEQASYCYLMSNPPLVRKYAFHIILSGYRFSKSGQKKHSSRAYRQGFQVYKGRGWELSENHILYTLGHQSLLLKDHYTASSLFNELVATTNSSKIQQMCHLREFFIVHHMREKEDKATATITIPFFQSQKSILDLTSESQSYEKLLEDTSWLDSDVLDHVKVHLNCQSVFGPLSQNLQIPQVAVDQSLRLLLPVSNPFQTPLLMRKVRLIWKFEIAADEKAILSSDSEAGNFIKMEPIDNVKIEKETPLVLDLNLVPLKSGQLSIEGIEYSLKALFPQSESTDYTIKGKQPLNVQGPRLNSTKDQKISKTPLYMKDSRLSLKIVEKLPKLKVQLKIPESLYQGQIYGVDVNFENVGNAPISQICLIHQNPGLLSLDNIENSTFSQEETIYDITKMELELAPGSQITKKLWICARKMENNFVYFSYNSPGEKGRLLKQSLSLKILPSMEVKAIQIQPCLHDDHGSLLAHITSSMEAIFIEQISMVSSRKRLKSLVSSNENQSISNGETSVIGCQIEKFEGEFVEISTLKASNSNEKNLNSTPFINFCPKFDKDLDILAVLWRNKQGQNGLIYTKITEENDEKSDQIDNLSSTESVDFPLIPSPKKACSVQAKVTQKNIKHDFDQDPLCLVPFEVEVENFLPTESIFRYKTTENGGADFGAQKFAGCNKATIPFDAESRQKLCFFVAVSSPGLFSYAGLSYQMTEKNEECDDDEYIPIQVNFLVE